VPNRQPEVAISTVSEPPVTLSWRGFRGRMKEQTRRVTAGWELPPRTAVGCQMMGGGGGENEGPAGVENGLRM
jgi:hypothetical protein